MFARRRSEERLQKKPAGPLGERKTGRSENDAAGNPEAAAGLITGLLLLLLLLLAGGQLASPRSAAEKPKPLARTRRPRAAAATTVVRSAMAQPTGRDDRRLEDARAPRQPLLTSAFPTTGVANNYYHFVEVW